MPTTKTKKPAPPKTTTKPKTKKPSRPATKEPDTVIVELESLRHKLSAFETATASDLDWLRSSHVHLDVSMQTNHKELAQDIRAVRDSITNRMAIALVMVGACLGSTLTVALYRFFG